MDKKITFNYMLPTRLISALKTHIGSKRMDGKRYFIQVETKRNQG